MDEFSSNTGTRQFDEGWWLSVLDEAERQVGDESLRGKREEKSKPSPDWDLARKLFHQDAIIELLVTGHNRGGLLVQGIGLYGFVPCSHLVDLPYTPDENNREEFLTGYFHKKIKGKIIECSQEEGRLVFSERAARVEAGKRPTLMSSINTGQQLSGEVTNITDFGVFIDLGGVEGLVHISELSWGRVTHPRQVCQVGQKVVVQVMEVNPERCRIALSIKRLFPNPWLYAQEKYPVDSKVPAEVTELVPYGVFARLEEGLEGLIHASEIPLPPEKTIRDILHPGQSVMVRVLGVESSRQRMGLSLKLV
jgi:small subunit ribosomal protein S1